MTPRLSQWIELACLLEATARKPGNVHPAAAFADVCYRDFVSSAAVIGPVLARSKELGVGRAVLQAVEATRTAVGRNTNLGMILLLAPLAAVPVERRLADGIGDVLDSLTVEDARLVYQAIRLSKAGGMGHVEDQDLAQEPTVTLLDAMRLAAGRDRIAEQYATGFRIVLERREMRDERLEMREDIKAHGPRPVGSASLVSPLSSLISSIIRLHLRLMSEFPDTLIARKRGWDEAVAAAERARAALAAGGPNTPAGRAETARLDAWLREEGHSRNPGTTADLVAASLFAAMREGRFVPPSKGQILEFACTLTEPGRVAPDR
ncbi:MAG: triphosphoribosyl-dephospho-CoA synthase, partial [Planctomycetaceae bacterium]